MDEPGDLDGSRAGGTPEAFARDPPQVVVHRAEPDAEGRPSPGVGQEQIGDHPGGFRHGDLAREYPLAGGIACRKPTSAATRRLAAPLHRCLRPRPLHLPQSPLHRGRPGPERCCPRRGRHAGRALPLQRGCLRRGARPSHRPARLSSPAASRVHVAAQGIARSQPSGARGRHRVQCRPPDVRRSRESRKKAPTSSSHAFKRR